MRSVGGPKALDLKISGLRSLMSMYMLTYGVFGYGSEISLASPLTSIPMVSGIVLGAGLFVYSRARNLDWVMNFRIDARMVAVFVLTFAFLLFAHRERLSEELIGDELAYIQISHAHSIQLLAYAPEAFGTVGSATLVRSASLLIILSVGLVIWLGVWRQVIS